MLWSYKFEILYKEGKKNGIAGWLKFVEVPLPGETSLHIEYWKSISVHGEELKKTLRLDQFLRQVTYLIHIYTELMDIEEQRQETSSLVHMKDVSYEGVAWWFQN